MAMILEHVNYSYGVGTGKEFHALKDINLQIGDHEFIGLVGHSGSGKSTLIQLMNGLLRATEGTIYWDGQDIYDKSFSMRSLRGQVGLVFQYPEYQLFAESVIADVEYGPRNLGWSNLDVEYRSYEALKQVGIVRHILIRSGKSTGQIMVCLVINGTRLPHKEALIEVLREANPQIVSICININDKNTNVILGRETKAIYGQDYIEDCIGSLRYRISAQSFYQVNPIQTKKLYDKALEYADLHEDETVWDLYCGIGTISLFLSQKADKVYGVEIVEQAVKNARENAALNEISNVEFFAGAAEEVVPAKYRESGGTLRSDVVVLDPPRKGCDEKLLQTVIQMEPKRIVYVSCDPATLARDLKYFGENGYVLKRICPCDMFGHSYHVETVCLLSKRSIMSM